MKIHYGAIICTSNAINPETAEYEEGGTADYLEGKEILMREGRLMTILLTFHDTL